MITFLTISLSLLPIFLLLTRKRPPQRLPPGSLGLPLIGQSLGLLRALRVNNAEEWLEERIRKYGPISKLSLFGTPTVFIYGQAANKLIFTSDDSTIANQQPKSIQMILGPRNLLELRGADHKRVRDALGSFLKTDSLKKYVEKMDVEIRQHLELHWQGQEKVMVLPLMETLTFDIVCSLLFGLERGTQRDKFAESFQEIIEGGWSVPVNLPFTRYNRSLRASERVRKMVKALICEKRTELEQKGASPNQDLITHLLSTRGEDNKQVLTEEEIVDNVMLIMVGKYDTSSVLITFIVRLLANDPAIYKSVLQEQEEIAKSKTSGEFLTWEDLTKMEYTWRVAMETLRMFPPVFGGFRKALKDIEYGGYLIPKGWQIFWAANKAHMDSNIFPEPSKFDPTRFENQEEVPPNPCCFLAFGGGARICQGYEFARIQTLAAVHHLVTRFAWKLCYTDNFFSRDPMPVPTQGLPVHIFSKKLLPNEAY